MGYPDDMPGGLQDMIEGEITQISPSFPAGDTPTVTVEGNSLLRRLLGTSNTRTFQSASDKDIAEKIGQELNLQVDADDAQIHYDYVMQAGQTDLEFLQARAKKIHFQLSAQGKKLLFKKSGEAGPTTYTLVWAQAQKAVAPNTLPLTTFSLKMSASTPPTQVQSRSWDPATKQAFVSKAGSSDQTSKMKGTTASGDVPSSAYNTERMLVHATTFFGSQSECDAHAKATYNNHAMGLVSGTAETIGVPALRAGSVIQMLGVGLRFEGYYIVDEATHSIGSDGYTTSLTVKRNAVS
jgi:phage protein D